MANTPTIASPEGPANSWDPNEPHTPKRVTRGVVLIFAMQVIAKATAMQQEGVLRQIPGCRTSGSAARFQSNERSYLEV